MNNYHILFKDAANNLTSVGKDYTAEDPAEAYKAWKEEYPDATYLGTFSKELLDLKS